MKYLKTFENINLGYDNIINDIDDILLELDDEGYITKSSVSRVWASPDNYDVFIDVRITTEDVKSDIDILRNVHTRLKRYMKDLGWVLVVDDLSKPYDYIRKNRLRNVNIIRWRKSHRGK